MNWDNYSEEQLRQLLPNFLEMAEVKDWNVLQNRFFIEDMNSKPKNPLFSFLYELYEKIGKEQYESLLSDWEIKFKDKQKVTFLNLVLEPRYITEATQHFLINRKRAIEMYEMQKESFSIVLELEDDNPFDGNAIIVFAEGKMERLAIGYISKSFNIRIGELLKNDAFPFIQTNYEDILNEKYSSDNVIIDIYF